MVKTRRRLEVPLNDTAASILAEKQAVKHGPHVFYNPVTGDRFLDLKAGFKAILERAGLTVITWHTLRHTFASWLTRSGEDLVTVKELLGHSTKEGILFDRLDDRCRFRLDVDLCSRCESLPPESLP